MKKTQNLHRKNNYSVLFQCIKKNYKTLNTSALMISFISLSASSSELTLVPEPAKFSAQAEIKYVPRSELWEYRGLDVYKEPEWVTENFVKLSKLPPIKERLPKEPLVFKTSNMSDGIGVYGDVLRHVIGGRPEGWNYSAGQIQGWGGIDIGTVECLTRTAPLFQVSADDLEPLPNLAKNWEWSNDGHKLTMHLIEGARWSDGDPFDAEDIMFYWEDNVLDPNVTPLNGATPETFGQGTTLKAIDDYTIEWTFNETFPKHYLFTMAYGAFCPGPSHMLKPQHPKYSSNTYDQYKNAFPPEFLNMPILGAWVPVEYRPDDIIVMRRNPYYWKVDETGQQLPYVNEIHYKLSTWADRDLQAISGSSDLSNLEQPENFVESLKRAAQETAPSKLVFGPRLIGYNVQLNFSANGWGQPNARGQAVRELNRNPEFRKAVTMAIDRKKLGEALVKGPFTAIYPGGLLSGSNFYDKASTYYYPYDVVEAKKILERMDLKDTDGDGFVNYPKDILNGQNVEIPLTVSNDYSTDKNLAEGVVGQLEQVGLRVILQGLPANQHEAKANSGDFDWIVKRTDSESASVVQKTVQLAPVGPRTSAIHRAGSDGTLDLMPFEIELADIVNQFIATNDNNLKVDLMKRYQQVATSNVNTIGLIEYPGAVIINKRFANVPNGTPINMFNWAEDALIRERLYVPLEKQKSLELHPNTLPGQPGKNSGPIR